MDAEVQKLVKAMRSFLCTVNGVTAYHRHGMELSTRKLDALSNRQIDMEALLKQFEETGTCIPLP